MDDRPNSTVTWQHALTESPSAHLTDAVVDRCHHTGDLIAATRYQSAWFAHRVDAAGNDGASRLLDLLSCCWPPSDEVTQPVLNEANKVCLLLAIIMTRVV